MNPSTVYLDNNATTRLCPEAFAAMSPLLDTFYANPSSPYGFARHASRALARAREQVAALIRVDPARVVFTSGGTESNHLALHAALAARPKRRRIVLSAVEHASLLASANVWANRGYEICVIPVSRDGALDREAFVAALDESAALVSVMAANNETGVCYPVVELSEQARKVGALFHTDAVQAVGKIPFEAGDFDFISLCAHKINGPKGVGALVIPQGIELSPMFVGGEQEFGLRAGTENVPAQAAFGAAAELASSSREEVSARLLGWRAEMERAVLAGVDRVSVIGRNQTRLPNTSFFFIEDVETEALLAQLDWAGFCCSAGSACAAGAHQTSHVAKAQGWTERGALLRVSTGRFTLRHEWENLVGAVCDGIKRLRKAQTS